MAARPDLPQSTTACQIPVTASAAILKLQTSLPARAVCAGALTLSVPLRDTSVQRVVGGETVAATRTCPPWSTSGGEIETIRTFESFETA